MFSILSAEIPDQPLPGRNTTLSQGNNELLRNHPIVNRELQKATVHYHVAHPDRSTIAGSSGNVTLTATVLSSVLMSEISSVLTKLDL